MLMTAAVQAPTTRPRDPWVFRSVLNKQPRMLTVALAEQLWLAYDTQSGTLVKAWSGGVNFTGGVYDTRHGPQPESQGETYFDQPAHGWSIERNGKSEPIDPTYRGYTLSDGGVTLNYTFDLGPTGKVEVQERPEVASAEGSVPQLHRAFAISGLQQGQRLVLRLPAGAEGAQPNLTFDRDGTFNSITELKASSK